MYMKGEKGSLINRIKDWFRMKKRKKLKKQQTINRLKKKQKQLEAEQKRKLLEQAHVVKYNKLQILNRVSFGLFLGFFESIITPQKKVIYIVDQTILEQQKERIQKIEMEVKKLGQQIMEASISPEELERQLKIQKETFEEITRKQGEQEIVFTSNKIKEELQTLQTYNIELVKRVMKEFQKVEDKVQVSKEEASKQEMVHKKETPKENGIESSKKQEKKIISKERVSPTIKELLKSIALTPFVIASIHKKDPERNSTLSEIHVEKQEKKKKKAIDLVHKKEVLDYLNKTKGKLEELKNDMQDYKEWTYRSKDSSSKKEYAVHILEDRMKELLKDYEYLKKQGFFLDMKQDEELKKADLYHLLTNEKEMLQFLSICEQEIQKLYIKRELQEEEKEQKIIEKKEELKEKKEKKPAKVKKGFTDLEDINLLNEIIDDNLKRQQLEIDKIKILFKQAEKIKKRKTFLSGIYNFLNGTIGVGLALLPLKLFKNKMVGIMGSGIVINNRLRNLRKLMNKQNNDIDFITYKTVAQQIHDEKSCRLATQAILDDTMQQLGYLKTEFFLEFSYDMERYPESELIQQQFQAIEDQILRRNMELQTQLEQLNILEEKSKEKVLTMD